jgi:UDP-N-acetylmuramoyl-tripeptide--D-alanyl-D-alanine ligase
VVDDSYNANPDSVRAAIDVLAADTRPSASSSSATWARRAPAGQFHDEIGGYAKSQGIDRLFALGELSRRRRAISARAASISLRIEDAAQGAVGRTRWQTTVVLVKGSRFMRMERVADERKSHENQWPQRIQGRNACRDSLQRRNRLLTPNIALPLLGNSHAA